MKLGEASELATFNRIVTTLEPESVTVHHLEPNKVEIVFPSGSYTISENNGFSVPGKNVIDGSLNGNVLTLVLDADVPVEDVLHGTMCDGTITNDGVSVSLDSVPVTNNTVESWLVIEEDSTVANFPKVQAQTKRAARFLEAILDPKRAAGPDYTCTVDFGVDTTNASTIAWAGARTFQRVSLDSKTSTMVHGPRTAALATRT